MVNFVRKHFSARLQACMVKIWSQVERHLPMYLRSVIWNGISFTHKACLGYLETHLVDHCNMNCRRCLHFSPLAEPWFADLESFAKDFERLSQLFKSIRTIRLMGGEPLLHSSVEKFFPVVRTAFPSSRIYLVTNGLLLAKQGNEFWEACRKNGIDIDFTVYPPMQSALESLRELCNTEGVVLRETPSDTFCVMMNYKGDSPRQSTFSACRNLFYCPLLKGGRIYGCAPSAFVQDFNERFGRNVPEASGVSIFDKSITGRKILRLLNRSMVMCCYCTADRASAPWSSGKPQEMDWDASSCK